MTTMQSPPVRIGAHGTVPSGAHRIAVSKVHSALRHMTRPVLSARVTLTMSGDPGVVRPAVAQATVDVNGRIVRAQAASQTMAEAIGLMSDRLRTRVDRVAQRRQSRRRRAGSCRTGSCHART